VAAAAHAPALVVAGPGTGKTSTLVGRVAHLVLDDGVDPGRILALTFSTRAAQEMRERVAALLALERVPDGAEDGDGSADTADAAAMAAQPVISTIHAFCGDLLRRYAPLVGLRPDYRVIAEAEGYLLLRRLARDLALAYYQPLAAPALHFPALLGAISRAKDELAGPERYLELAVGMIVAARAPEDRLAGTRAVEVARVYQAYQAGLAATGDADYGDLIRLAVRLLEEHPEVLADLRGRYGHILVDEFQDINRAMGVLLRVLAGPAGPLWAVGDADQAIYRFRGASPANLTRFHEEYPGAGAYPLRTNYRSRGPILRVAAAVAGALLGGGERAPLAAARDAAGVQSAGVQSAEVQAEVVQGPEPRAGRKRGRGVARRAERATEAEVLAASAPEQEQRPEHGPERGPERAVVTLAAAPDEAAELAGLAAAIRDRMGRGYAPSDQAVLCRTRRQCQRVAAALASAGLPARVVTPLLDQPDVKDVLSVVLLLADSSGAGLLRAGAVADHAFTRAEARAVLLAARARHVAPLALLGGRRGTLDEVAGLSPEGRAGLERLGAVLDDLWAASDVTTGLGRYIFGLTDLARRALADPAPDGRPRAANLARLLALARGFEDQRRAADPAAAHPRVGGAAWAEFVDYVRVLTNLGREAPGGADDLLAVATEGVRVLTVHASKGLEFPVVYLPGLCEGRFPTQRRADPTPPPVGLVDDEALAARDAGAHRAEEACLFYVAITRARDELVLSHADRYGRRRYTPSAFLKPVETLAADAESGVARQRWPERDAEVVAREGLATAGASSVGDGDGDEEGDGAAEEGLAAEPEPVLPAEEPLSVSAIETYQRCPRQYAYRYVYGLRPHEVGLGTLRRGLHAALRELQERFAAVGPGGAANGGSANGGQSVEGVGIPSLREARALFVEQWRVAVAADAGTRAAATERHDPGAEAAASAETGEATDNGADHEADRDAERGADLAGPFGTLYRSHGLRVVERAWQDLASARGLAPLADPDVAVGAGGVNAAGPPEMDATGADARGQTPAPRPAPLPLAARLEERVTVRVGGRDVEVTLDRVEDGVRAGEPAAAASPAGRSTRLPAPADVRDDAEGIRGLAGGMRMLERTRPADAVAAPMPAPVRFIRHRLGRTPKTPPDLRTLLYDLAARQHGQGARHELYQHNLTTGELETVRLDPRRTERLRDDLDAALAGMARGVYPAKPEQTKCAGCPFLLVCPA
jgi:superfamily I DNA/RNA helicase